MSKLDQRAEPQNSIEGDSATGLAPRTGYLRGLSTKLLALTILFVMLGEVLIFVPSIAKFRIDWLQDRLSSAKIASLVLEAAPDNMVPDTLRTQILESAGAVAIAYKRGEQRSLLLKPNTSINVVKHFDLRTTSGMRAIMDAFDALFAGNGRIIRVIGNNDMADIEFMEIVLDETPLRMAMIQFGFNILALSIVLSLLVATSVFLALNWVMVRPMRRITMNMLRFSENPEDASRVIQPSMRQDEIGTAERELQNMQDEMVHMLQQKTRLAALGLAVSKISHDLRNMLASAQLISDRLILIDDPTVKKFAPKLIMSLDRAIDFCAQTLKYGRAQEAPPRRDHFFLRMIVDDAIDATAPQTSHKVVLYNDVPQDVKIDADREHIFRILSNLMRNSVEALQEHVAANDTEGEIRLNAWRNDDRVTIEVGDNGPGVPEKARAHLFEAFQGSVRAGGTGLGLAIASELARAHGGFVELKDRPQGAHFWVVIPDRSEESSDGRRGELEIA
ncbi:MAG: HAMP domain-containing sensor histidine kinase [Pseudomonadota bacterium]